MRLRFHDEQQVPVPRKVDVLDRRLIVINGPGEVAVVLPDNDLRHLRRGRGDGWGRRGVGVGSGVGEGVSPQAVSRRSSPTRTSPAMPNRLRIMTTSSVEPNRPTSLVVPRAVRNSGE